MTATSSGASGTVYTAFGAHWRSDVALTQFDAATPTGDDESAIAVDMVQSLQPRTAVRQVNGGTVHDDGFRLMWRDEATFDMYDGTRIEYLPGPGWTGTMPAAFYSTVAALTLAWRGALPCHASTVEIGGRAVMIAGPSGAGKSTLTAALLDRGARLIADDLTIVSRLSEQGGFVAFRGRPWIRLHADSAARLPASDRRPVPEDHRGKWLVRPAARTAIDATPLTGIVMLDGTSGAIDGAESAIRLGPHLFRPRWLAALPDHAGRLRTMLAIANEVPFRGIDPGGGFHCDRASVDHAWRVATDLVEGA